MRLCITVCALLSTATAASADITVKIPQRSKGYKQRFFNAKTTVYKILQSFKLHMGKGNETQKRKAKELQDPQMTIHAQRDCGGRGITMEQLEMMNTMFGGDSEPEGTAYPTRFVVPCNEPDCPDGQRCCPDYNEETCQMNGIYEVMTMRCTSSELQMRMNMYTDANCHNCHTVPSGEFSMNGVPLNIPFNGAACINVAVMNKPVSATASTEEAAAFVGMVGLFGLPASTTSLTMSMSVDFGAMMSGSGGGGGINMIQMLCDMMASANSLPDGHPTRVQMEGMGQMPPGVSACVPAGGLHLIESPAGKANAMVTISAVAAAAATYLML